MSCDIYSFAEVRENGKWQYVTENCFCNCDAFDNYPFSSRQYKLFGFLANVRNDAECLFFEQKGFPDDSEYLNEIIKSDYDDSYIPRKKYLEESNYYFDFSYLTLKELLDFDYSQQFENQKIKKIKKSYDYVEGTAWTSVEDFLSNTDLFETIEVLKELGRSEDVRVVFHFVH